MFRTEKSVRVLQAVAAIASLAVLLWSLGLPSIRIADAANLTAVSDTLSDTATSTVANHTIVFTTPTGVAAGEDVVITFQAGEFDLSNILVSDIDFASTTGDELLDYSASGATWGMATTSDTITFTSGTSVMDANATITIQIGDHASAGSNQIVNPGTVGPYDIDITAGSVDSGSTIVVILSPVKVTASVDTTFQFTVAGVASGETVNGTTTTGTTTATTIPFGTLDAGVGTTTAQLLTVETNASNGFVVTVQSDGNLLSATGADIDPFNNGTEVTNPTAWQSPSNTLGNDATYGHWGVTSDDVGANRLGEEFGSDEWAAISTSTVNVMANNGPANGTVMGAGTTTVGFHIEIGTLQEAGDDYEAVLTYIATPTF